MFFPPLHLFRQCNYPKTYLTLLQAPLSDINPDRNVAHHYVEVSKGRAKFKSSVNLINWLIQIMIIEVKYKSSRGTVGCGCRYLLLSVKLGDEKA